MKPKVAQVTESKREIIAGMLCNNADIKKLFTLFHWGYFHIRCCYERFRAAKHIEENEKCRIET